MDLPGVLIGVAQILVPIATIIVASLGLKHSRNASVQSTEANDAVNNVHATGKPRIYDLVVENKDRGELLTSALHQHIDRVDVVMKDRDKQMKAMQGEVSEIKSAVGGYIESEIQKEIEAAAAEEFFVQPEI